MIFREINCSILEFLHCDVTNFFSISGLRKHGACYPEETNNVLTNFSNFLVMTQILKNSENIWTFWL